VRNSWPKLATGQAQEIKRYKDVPGPKAQLNSPTLKIEEIFFYKKI